MKNIIEKKLQENFLPFHLEVINNSHLHNGHFKAPSEDLQNQTHFMVKIGSKKFSGLSRVLVHRQINKLLEEEFKKGLHALEIKIVSQ
jgi:BolA protein